MNDDSNPAISAAPRRIHPLVAMAAVSVTAVSAIAAYQFLWPQSARSETAQEALHESAKEAGHHAAVTPPPPPMAGAMQAPPPAICRECGEVVAIRTARKEGEGTGVGAVAGGVVGGVLGHQVGGGRGKEAMTVLGAVGGLFAGNEAEKQVRAQTLYLVDLRMADGSQRTVTRSVPPEFGIGTSVRVSGNTIMPM